jgi:hypothetical protein
MLPQKCRVKHVAHADHGMDSEGWKDSDFFSSEHDVMFGSMTSQHDFSTISHNAQCPQSYEL